MFISSYLLGWMNQLKVRVISEGIFNLFLSSTNQIKILYMNFSTKRKNRRGQILLLSNNSADSLIIFLKKSSLHNLIPSCRFIYFWKQFLKYFSPMSTQGKKFVHEFCVLWIRHKIHARNFCLVYSWVKNTLPA